MNVTLNDGNVKEFKNSLKVIEIAKVISSRLANEAIAAIVNGKLVDLNTVIEEDCELKILSFENEEGKEIFRHTSALILAQAVKRLFPDAKLAKGSVIDKGFYYDFDIDIPFKSEDLLSIEKEMNSIVAEKVVIERRTISREDAVSYFRAKNENYKIELIEEIPPNGEISICKQGDFIDLCNNQNLMSTAGVKGIKLLSSTGAYWRGNEKNKMLQRIYGVSFPKRSLLEEHMNHLEEIKMRDHNKIGRELELFTTVDSIGQGLPLLLPKGAKIIQVLQRFVEDEEERRGYELTKTPLMAKSDLYKISGHWSLYKDGMFIIPDGPNEDDALALRPMTCPFQFFVYKSKQHSYRDLPKRYAETSTLFRNESSGEMHGLIRVRQFTISEGHLIVTPDQLEFEFKEVVNLINFMMNSIGIFNDVTYRFSKWDKSNNNKYVGSSEQWENTQNTMRDILVKLGLKFTEVEGEAAFYGPKLDIQFKNVHGKEDTIITVQIDFSLAERFDLTYIDRNGEKKRPIIIHRTSIGCYERTLAMLIEKYAGKFPTWLAPVQVKVLSISDTYNDYSLSIVKTLLDNGVRAESDIRVEKIGYKIREAQLEKVPYMIIIGENEALNKKISVRSRINGVIGQMSLQAFLDILNYEISERVLNTN